MSQKMSQNVTKMSKNVTLLESAGLQWIPAEQVGECKVLDISSISFNKYNRIRILFFL